MSISYPFLAVSRARQIPYGTVLAFVDHYTHPKRDHWETQALQDLGSKDRGAILDALDKELKRRLSVKETGS